jgi:hypothetical protein
MLPPCFDVKMKRRYLLSKELIPPQIVKENFVKVQQVVNIVSTSSLKEVDDTIF